MKEDWILRIPPWSGQLNFDRETVRFVLILLLLAFSVLLCFLGYRYFQTIALMAVGGLLGAAGLWIGLRMTENLLLLMSFFVMFTFLGVCLCYFLSTLLVHALRRSGALERLREKTYLLAAVYGAAAAGGITYLCVLRNGLLVGLGAAALLTAGGLHGRKQAAKQPPFYTYDDLVQMPPLREEEPHA